MRERPHVMARILDGAWRRGRRTDPVLAWLFVPMAVSGFLPKVTTSDATRRALVVAHVGTGVACLAGWLAHLASTRGWIRTRRSVQAGR